MSKATAKGDPDVFFAANGHCGLAFLGDGTKVGPQKTLLNLISVDKAGTGFCHFSSTLCGEYFLQITSEKLVKTTKDFPDHDAVDKNP